MSITSIEYLLLRTLRQKDLLPLDGDILEIGQANWYGDVGLNNLKDDIAAFAPAQAQADLLARLDEIVAARRPSLRFEIAELYWTVFLRPRSMTAIDFHGTSSALKLDLNAPIDLKRRFQLVMNLGTAEHVFDVAQTFRTIHDHTEPGGLMIHGLPFTGWVDHGFYCFQPTFHWDLAAANGYEVVTALYAELEPLRLVRLNDRDEAIGMAKRRELGDNGLIYSVLRRPAEVAPLRAPIQGYYAGNLSDAAVEAWKTLR